MTIAALFVAAGGIYCDRADVDAWDVQRDARAYAGPHAVVAHPPCERWGKYAQGGPNPNARRRDIGDDAGCFASALASVRAWCGVLEHPAASHAWARFGLAAPPHTGGWVFCGPCRGRFDVLDGCAQWTCHVEQGHYGHRARKATWLFACLPSFVAPPSLRWGPSRASLRMDRGFHSKEERELHKRAMRPPAGMTQEQRDERRAYLENIGAWACPERMSKRERTATPPAFADLLVSIARSVRRLPP